MFAFFKALKRSDATPLLARIAAGEMILIDLREAGERAATGAAQGALHLPLGRLAQAADPSNRARHKALRPDTPVALYCATGARSAQGVMTLRRLGYGEVHNLGGLGHWQAAGGQITR